MWLEGIELKLLQGDKEKLDNDIRLFGTGWLYITEGHIGERIDPCRVTVKPETVKR